MRQSLKRVALACGLSVSLGFAAPAVAAAEKAPAIDPQAIKVLRAMSDYLNKAQTFSFNVEVSYDVVYGSDEKLTFLRSGNVVVRRPNRFKARISELWVSREFYYDGKSFTLWDPSLNLYATTTAPGTIDAAIDDLNKRFGVAVPIGQLMRSNIFALVMDRVVAAGYISLTKVRGKEAHHLALASADLDWQVWVATGDKPVPLLIVGTVKNEKHWPQYRAWLTNWKTGQTVFEKAFRFRPPKGAEKITLLPAGSKPK